LPLHPTRYAELLHDRITRHRSHIWLVNTGWTGGPYGVGHRMKLSHTRALLRAALSGSLAQAQFTPDPLFGVLVPQSCPGVPAEVLRPRTTWKDPTAYDEKARQLAGLFQKNFQTYAAQVSEAVRQAGPRVWGARSPPTPPPHRAR